MQSVNFGEVLEQILQEDTRYAPEAYLLLREALDFTMNLLQKPRTGPQKHVSGQELCEGIRLYATREYGPMAYRVLTSWGLRRTEDFGEIVFNLVEKGVLGKTESDRKEDFAGGYDFVEAFVKPFLPPPAPGDAKHAKAQRERRKSPTSHHP